MPTVHTPNPENRALPKFLRHHTVVVSYLALFFAVGGSAAYAQQRWMVSSADVVDESLTSADLGLASVGTSEVAYGSLTDNDLGTGSVRAAELDIKVQRPSNQVSGNAWSKTVTATCPPGYVVLGGGGNATATYGGGGKIAMTRSEPSGTTGWTVSAEAISFPAKKTNWDHRHDGDDFNDVVWKDWLWYDSDDYSQDWTLDVSAVCAEL
jgi:hypothetical protein